MGRCVEDSEIVHQKDRLRIWYMYMYISDTRERERGGVVLGLSLLLTINSKSAGYKDKYISEDNQI